jgi:hypothetical protein
VRGLVLTFAIAATASSAAADNEIATTPPSAPAHPHTFELGLDIAQADARGAYVAMFGVDVGATLELGRWALFGELAGGGAIGGDQVMAGGVYGATRFGARFHATQVSMAGHTAGVALDLDVGIGGDAEMLEHIPSFARPYAFVGWRTRIWTQPHRGLALALRAAISPALDGPAAVALCRGACSPISEAAPADYTIALVATRVWQ